mgnify:CR=1 FL=1
MSLYKLFLPLYRIIIRRKCIIPGEVVINRQISNNNTCKSCIYLLYHFLVLYLPVSLFRFALRLYRIIIRRNVSWYVVKNSKINSNNYTCKSRIFLLSLFLVLYLSVSLFPYRRNISNTKMYNGIW